MPIPSNITKEHILQAMDIIRKKPFSDMPKNTKFVVEFEGFPYPVKLLVAYANIFANGEELDRNPNNFQTQMAIKFLERFGFKIVDIKKSQTPWSVTPKHQQ